MSAYNIKEVSDKQPKGAPQNLRKTPTSPVPSKQKERHNEDQSVSKWNRD